MPLGEWGAPIFSPHQGIFISIALVNPERPEGVTKPPQQTQDCVQVWGWNGGGA